MSEFKIKKEDIKKIIDETGACIVSNQILFDGKKVGYMYRENPSVEYNDTGWRFFSGDETDEYCNNPENFNIVELNTLCNYDNSVINLLKSKITVAYIRDKNGCFVEEKTNNEEKI